MKTVRYVLAFTVLSILIFSMHTPTYGQIDLDDDSKVFEEDEMPNIIMMIGDGMGPEQIKAASLVEYGAENMSIMDLEFPFKDTYGTNTINNITTDSAAGGTAFATGQKTKYNWVSVSEDETYYMKTILEYLVNDFGYASGLVTTSTMSHATPAVFASHTNDRNNVESIFPQMMAQDIDIMLGGGYEFSQIGESGARLEGGNNGYDLAFTRDSMNAKLPNADKLFGLFGHQLGEGHMPYELIRNTTIDPSLIEMTEGAIDFLDRKDKPFFLMVEGARIDHAGHLSSYNNETRDYKTKNNVVETIMFEKSIRSAYEFAKNDGNTIVIVGADHETGGLEVLDFSNLDDELPSESNTREENMDIRVRRALQLDVFWLWNAHTDIQIPFYAYGSDFGGMILNHSIDLFWFLNHALGSFPTPLEFHFTPFSGEMNVNMEVFDLDKSVTAYQIRVDESGVETSYDYIVDLDSRLFTINENVTVPAEGDYYVYVHLNDSNQRSINSFSSQNELIRIPVTHKVNVETSTTSEITSGESSTTPPTSTTQTTSEEATSPFSLIFPVTMVVLLRRKKRSS